MRGLLAQITVRVLGSVSRKSDLMPVIQRIVDTIHIIGENGEDLMLTGMDFSDLEGCVL